MSAEGTLITDLMANYGGMSDKKKGEVDQFLADRSANRMWFPTPGPQLDAVNCKADVMLYGGSGGCGMVAPAAVRLAGYC
jgi:hypothetical protein